LVNRPGFEPTVRGRGLGNPALPYWVMTLHYGRDEARMIVNWCDETSQVLQQMQAKETGTSIDKQPGKTTKKGVTHAS
jgi:hypothetical protein